MDKKQDAGLLDLLNTVVDAGGKKPALITPGVEQERVAAAAMDFLRQKKVDVERFTHARALREGNVWEVALFEAVNKPRLGGFEYRLTLEEPSLRIVKWSKMQ